MRYLLTWYGITDLRASMGFEAQGPVLGALASGQFDCVKILAYTKKTDFSAEELAEQQETIQFLLQNREAMAALPYRESMHYVDVLANTPAGHRFFQNWLEKRLEEAALKVDISMQECVLKELNDTEGIYFAVLNLLKEVPESEAEITFYLSPGTPVMAFSWALAMLASPKRKIRLLASPDSRKGLQTIEITQGIIDNIKSNWR